MVESVITYEQESEHTLILNYYVLFSFILYFYLYFVYYHYFIFLCVVFPQLKYVFIS